jgi:hypothetical protein
MSFLPFRAVPAPESSDDHSHPGRGAMACGESPALLGIVTRRGSEFNRRRWPIRSFA